MATEEDQLRQVAAATPAQRLAWLEEALSWAYASGVLRPLRREPKPKEVRT